MEKRFNWKIDKKYQYSIYAAIITNCIAYLYYISHSMHNYDSIAIFEHGVGASVDFGRWLLNILHIGIDRVCDNGGYFHTTVINTFGAAVLIEICCLLVIAVYEIEEPLECIAVTVVTIAFPVVGATMLFNYTVVFYMMAAALSTLAVWFAKMGKWWSLLTAAVLLAFGLGIYQAYFPYGAALLVILLLQQAVVKKLTAGKVILNAVKYFGVLAAAYFIYLGITKYWLWKLGISGMSSYQGMDNMGKIDLVKLPYLIFQAYLNFFSLAYKNYMGLSAAKSIQILFGILFLCIFLMYIMLCINERKNILKILVMSVLLGVFPVAADAITVIAPESGIYTLMVMGMVTVFYLPVIIYKGLPKAYNIRRIFGTVICSVILVTGCFYCYQANANYTELYYMNERTENFFSVLSSRIVSQPGYRSDMDIVFAGEYFSEDSQSKSYDIGELRWGGNYFDANVYSRNSYMRIYFGKECRELTREEKERYKEVLAEMGVYPDYSAVRIVDGSTVLVKIEDLEERQ